jgi:VanZ family protein
LKTFTHYWLPVVVWIAVIFTLSTDAFSAEHTGSVLEYIIVHTVGPVEMRTFEYIHFITRKLAHVTEYGILGLLLFRAWRGEHRGQFCAAWVRQSLGIVMMVAALDEFHQSLVPSRGSSPWDALLDTLGAALFLAIAYLIWQRKTPRYAT